MPPSVVRCILPVALAVAVALPSGVRAQATVPGSPAIQPTRIRFGVVEYTLTMVRGDEEEFIGTIRDEIVPIRGNDPLLQRVYTLKQGDSFVVDSSLTDLETLAPRWHRSVQPKRDMMFDVDGLRVAGAISQDGKPLKTISTVLKDLAFDASNWDLIVRALPLADGDAAVLSVYSVENELHRFTIRVVDRKPRGSTDVIHVHIDMGKGREAHAWFEENTRVLLRLETELGPDLLMRQVMRRP